MITNDIKGLGVYGFVFGKSDFFARKLPFLSTNLSDQPQSRETWGPSWY